MMPPAPNVGRLADLIRVAARRQPQAVAVQYEGSSCTYDAFYKRSLQIARALQTSGFLPGERIVMFGRNSLDYLQIYTALQIGGFVAVPANFRLTSEELVYILQNSEARGIVIEAEFLPMLDAERRRLALRDKDIIVIGDDLNRLCAKMPSDPMPCAGSPHDAAAIFYTSGTTGFPKGATLSHIALLIRFSSWGWKFGITDDDVVLVPGPIFHQSFCSIAMIALCTGGRVFLHRDFDPPAILQAIARHRVTWSFMVPKMLAALVDEIATAPKPPDLQSIRTVLSSGARLPKATLDGLRAAVPHARVCDAYGWTESGWITVSSQDDLVRKELSVGRPTFGCELAILDPEGQEVAPGVVGRIYAANPVPFLGYHANPAATAAMRVGRWETGGDIGYQDEEGYLYILDRERDVIITGGENVYPAEIERVLADHPDIMDVAVVGVPDPTWGETPRACVVLHEDRSPTDTEILAFCTNRIAKFKHPRSIVRFEALPRNSMGKVLRRELRSQFWTEHEGTK